MREYLSIFLFEAEADPNPRFCPGKTSVGFGAVSKEKKSSEATFLNARTEEALANIPPVCRKENRSFCVAFW